jgi:hypothetical protein
LNKKKEHKESKLATCHVIGHNNALKEWIHSERIARLDDTNITRFSKRRAKYTKTISITSRHSISRLKHSDWNITFAPALFKVEIGLSLNKFSLTKNLNWRESEISWVTLVVITNDWRKGNGRVLIHTIWGKEAQFSEVGEIGWSKT